MTTPMTAAACERLIKLAEEAGELVQACMKVLHHGWDGKYESGETNREYLEKEIGDVRAILDMMVEASDLDCNALANHIAAKRVKVLKFTYFQEGSELKLPTSQP